MTCGVEETECFKSCVHNQLDKNIIMHTYNYKYKEKFVILQSIYMDINKKWSGSLHLLIQLLPQSEI